MSWTKAKPPSRIEAVHSHGQDTQVMKPMRAEVWDWITRAQPQRVVAYFVVSLLVFGWLKARGVDFLSDMGWALTAGALAVALTPRLGKRPPS